MAAKRTNRNKQVEGMTGMQALFVEEYLRCWSAREAAKRAGYKDPDNQGYRNLRLPYIQKAIKARMRAFQMETDEVMMRLTQQARNDLGDYLILSEDGKKFEVDWVRLKEAGHLVKKISYSQKGQPVIEFHDSQRALEIIARAKGMFVDRQEVKVGELNPVQVYIPDNGRGNSSSDTEPKADDGTD